MDTRIKSGHDEFLVCIAQMHGLHFLVVPAKAGTYTPCLIGWVRSPKPSVQ